jgi:UPF0271 protein
MEKPMRLNADLGEGEPAARTRTLLGIVDLASIACGGHAGDLSTMKRTIQSALANNVAIGAHPGFPDLKNFGRAKTPITPDELALLVVQQVGGFAAVCQAFGAKLHHIKLHGSLYHATEASAALARRYVETVAEFFPKAKIIALAGGRVAALAGSRALAEVFADRGYRADGSLVPRGQPGDLIHDAREVTRRLPSLRGDTICVHGDSPQAIRIARAVRKALSRG